MSERERCEVCAPDGCTCATPSQLRELAYLNLWRQEDRLDGLRAAAERERDQLRADNNRWREQGTAWVDQHLALAHENDQLRAERDQALTLLRQVKELAIDCEPIQIRLLLTASGLLDDEGQQR